MARGGRIGVNPNVDSPVVERTRRVDYITAGEAADREERRMKARADALALANTRTPREAEARREVPQTRTDSLNPNKTRSLPSPSAQRRPLSSNMQKDLNKTKRTALAGMSQTRFIHATNTLRDREKIEGVNRLLHGVVGLKSELRTGTQKRVRSIDLAIGDFERENEREHVVYSVLASPKAHGNSRNALARRLEAMSKSDYEGDRDIPFDSYIPATHSLGEVPDGPDVVMEIRTTSGMYVGTSDTTPDADHIVGRGRVLRPVGVHTVSYVRKDGTQGERRIVQMEDVTPNI